MEKLVKRAESFMSQLVCIPFQLSFAHSYLFNKLEEEMLKLSTLNDVHELVSELGNSFAGELSIAYD